MKTTATVGPGKLAAGHEVSVFPGNGFIKVATFAWSVDAYASTMPVCQPTSESTPLQGTSGFAQENSNLSKVSSQHRQRLAKASLARGKFGLNFGADGLFKGHGGGSST
jgi:hypothetical protein